MDLFLQASAAVLLALILILTLNKQSKELSTLLSLAVCVMVALIAISFLRPVIDFLHQLETLSQLDNGMLEILLKVVGIGLLGQLSTLICEDSGNSAMGKALQVLTSAVILWLAVPLLQELVLLVKEILGEV